MIRVFLPEGGTPEPTRNVFNTSLTLAREDTATDDDYESIEGVIGHEYFHNWTGNRVTCRDWFQLTLKEGLTVYRDQEFSSETWLDDLPRQASPGFGFRQGQGKQYKQVGRSFVALVANSACKLEARGRGKGGWHLARRPRTWAPEHASALKMCASCARTSSRRTPKKASPHARGRVSLPTAGGSSCFACHVQPF